MVGRFESGKDIVQDLTESTATHVGRITTIITDAVRDVSREIGELVTDGMEMREARKRALADHDRHEAALDDVDDPTSHDFDPGPPPDDEPTRHDGLQ